MAPAAPTNAPARIVQVGASGFGRVHRERIAAAQQRGEAELVAVVDPFVGELAGPDAGVPLLGTLPEALQASGRVDVVSIAAPIAEHAELATLALQAGADVLLEKPPVAVWSDFERLLELQRSTGRLVQVGFQSLATDGADLLGSDALGLGALQQVGAVGLWLRTLGYWSRSPWAGRRTLEGRPVVDGVVTNPLAHAVATALAVVGCRRAEDVDEVGVELFRANAIDADDTSVVRVRTTGGDVVTCALTLCSPVQQDPWVEVVGERGRARYLYTEDRIEVTTADGSRTVAVTRTDPLANLLAARRGEVELMVPLVSTGAFMRVMDAVGRTTPVPIPASGVRWVGEGADRHPEVEQVEHWAQEAVRQGRTFTELGVPWARAGATTA
ncbi:Gfo/Idh/MocA family protein [Desertihabitans aurantiacus]|uniref:Gfo/Idh/MocA family protein n=1 Tax=Desertihabitans aurantiacus TaxID=2282477 RepID=UPI000DF79B57|nr:Gfo/Idh/MocA family oxidoreductase [Desertihabitans aurantiacus]